MVLLILSINDNLLYLKSQIESTNRINPLGAQFGVH
jgi:hypothetical protein